MSSSKNTTSFLIGLAVLAGLYIAFSKNSKMGLEYGNVLVRSTVDNEFYSVQQSSNSVQAANLLARAKQKMLAIIHNLDSNNPKLPPIQRRAVQDLKKLTQANGIIVSEMTKNMGMGPTVLAFNVSKTEGIFLCIRTSHESEELVDDVSVFRMLMHEMAHTMTDQMDPLVNGVTEHSQTFYDNEDVLKDKATDMGFPLISMGDPKVSVCANNIKWSEQK